MQMRDPKNVEGLGKKKIMNTLIGFNGKLLTMLV